MGQPLRSIEDEETIDLMELARLLWAHIVQIVAAAVAAAHGTLPKFHQDQAFFGHHLCYYVWSG